ncbi:MAG: hypothetical protein U1E43_00325 [Rhodospirillales bacterium]
MSARRRPPSTSPPPSAAIEQRVDVIDLDPQGNASTGLGISPADRRPGAYQVLSGEAGFAAALQDRGAGLDIIPPAPTLPAPSWSWSARRRGTSGGEPCAASMAPANTC